MKLIRKVWMIFLVLLLAFLSIGQKCDDNGDGRVTHQLQISRHTPTASLTNARADQILADMSTILQVNDGPGDVACNVAFTRSGNVTTFATGTGTINSAADFNAVNGLPGNVKVVDFINWCGGISPGTIGCAPVPGTSFVVERFTLNQEGLLWVHEFGHNKGLPHRDVANAVMRPFINVDNKRVNSSECDSYRVAAAFTAK